MPEYTAPGAYVEETAFRAKSIEGVHTSTTAFVGPTRKGPYRVDEHTPEPPELLTSEADFERIYGSGADLALGAGVPGTHHLAHAVRAFFSEGGSRLYVSRAVGAGAAAASVEVVPGEDEGVRFVARFPGVAGNGQVVVREQVSAASGAEPHALTVVVLTVDGDGQRTVHADLSLDRAHPRWIGHVMAAQPLHRRDHLHHLYAIHVGAGVSAAALHAGLFHGANRNAAGQLERTWTLVGGADGGPPTPTDHALALSEIAALEDVSIVAAPGSSAYGVGEGHEDHPRAIAAALVAHAERDRAYRIAVLDTPPGLSPTEALAYRGHFESTHAALYFPWVVVPNPLARPGLDGVPKQIALPPSGFLCGIYARNDVERGVHQAPANEVVRGALRFETEVNAAQQDLLNPAGLNCLRFFSGRGHRVWGARLVSSDPDWTYVNVRRYVNALQASIDRGTRWAVFEPNGERLWANIRQTIADHLHNEWQNGVLLGLSPEAAFFVRCDRSTMTQNDLDNGRLVCLVGVAISRPAEFLIFRIGQKTADARG